MNFIIRRPKLKRAVLFPNPYKPTMASARIAKFIAEELDVELWDSPEKIKYETIDELYFIYGMVAFSTFREEMGALHPYVKKYIYIENDFLGCHLTQLRKPLRERGIVPIMLTTCPHRLIRSRGWYVNWNQFTWDPVPVDKIADQVRRTPGLAYYGFFRKDRIDYFNHYFNTDLYDIHTFCGRGGQSKFRAINPRIRTNPQAIDLNETLNSYSFTLYIEDKFSHKRFSSVANRFYECLAAGIPILFDVNTIGTMDLGGFDVRRFSVSCPGDIRERILSLDDIGKSQLSWRRDFRAELKSQFQNLIYKIAATDPCGNTCP